MPKGDDGPQVDLNGAEQDPQTHRLVHELFEERVREQPDAIAVTCGDVNLTYKCLDDRANALAWVLLASCEISSDTRIALVLDRSEHVLISMLAVLKAGGAYVPLAPDSPDRRIEGILRESRPVVVLTNDRYHARLSSIVDVAQLSVDVLAVEKISGLEEAPKRSGPVPAVRPDHLAYVIYTSGTSGHPKGVMVEHQSVVNYVCSAGDRLKLSAHDTCGYSTNLSFDLTVTTTLACLALGGRVAVYWGDARDLDAYRRFLVEYSVTTIKLTPSYFGLVAATLHETSVRTVVLGGEKLSLAILERIRERADQKITVYDEYGPTEATVGICAAVVHPLPVDRTLNIGSLYANCQAFVLDVDLQPVQAGEVGELFIGGTCLARGYLEQPELTAERFLPNPIQKKDGPKGLEADCASRIYRTGDLVRQLLGGELEYIGRNDNQIKIRGFRVELGEIEHAIESYGDIDRAAVVAGTARLGNEARSLVAYVIAGEFGCSEQALSEYLSDILPEYMLPSAYLFLDEFPLTPNGKVDFASLPKAKKRRTKELRPPRTELECKVAEIWAGMLGLESATIGVTDDFFSLGGDSIIAIQVVGRMRQDLRINVSVAEMLNQPTIEGICDFLDGWLAEQPSPLPDVQGEAPLLPVQEWFFRSDFASPHHWNQAFLIATPPLDVDRLRECVQELGHRHDAFRTRFGRNPVGEVVQYDAQDFQPTDLVVGSVADIRDLQAQLTAWQADFDFKIGPVYRIGYLDGFEDGSARVFVACHHLIVDAISWRVIAEDLEALYHARELLSVGSTYRQWSTFFRQYEELYPDERGFWQEFCPGSRQDSTLALQSLVTDEASKAVSQLVFDQGVTERLHQCCQVYSTQVNEILLTALSHALADLTGEPVNDIVLEGHGREELDPRLDIGRTLGWFTTMFPVRLEKGQDQLETLRETKETLRKIPKKGLGYGALHGYFDDRLPRINFNYLGRLDTAVSAQTAGRWRLTREPAGEAMHPSNCDNNIITINCWIVDGKLSFTFANKLGKATGDHFAKLYEKYLVELVEKLSAAPRTYLTPSDIDHVISAEYLDELQADREIESVHLANSLQQGFIFQAIAHGQNDDAYIVQKLWEYTAPVYVVALREAWMQAQLEFPALRLRFGWQEQLVQVVDAEPEMDWIFLDLSDKSVEESEASVRRLREADRCEPYDLGTGPLFRVYLIKRDHIRFSCLFSHHHSILDGWSITVLLSRVHALYEALLASLPEDIRKDHSYSAGQKYLQQHCGDHTEFWRDYLAHYDERMDLNGLLSSEARSKGLSVGMTRHVKHMRDLSFTLSGTEFDWLRQTAQDLGVTLNAIFLYVWNKTLASYTNAEKTVTGVVLSGRGIPVKDIDRSVGLFINTLPLVVPHSTCDETVLDGIRAIQRQISEFNARSTVNLAELHQRADRLFDTLFIYENWPKISPGGWQKQFAVRMGAEYEKLDYPVSIIVSEAPESVHFRLAYAAELFDGRYMSDMLDMQRHLLDEVMANAERPWREVDLISGTRHSEITRTPGIFVEPLPSQPTIVEAFERQARRRPYHSAATFEGTSLTYSSLDERANRLANLLIEVHGVQPQELIVLFLDKGPDLVSSILAVLKAGAVYVLVDPVYPDRRISYILQDTAARLAITAGRHVDRLSAIGGSSPTAAILALDSSVVCEALSRLSPQKPAMNIPVDGLMYVLYTSGTTGVPKGVMIEHQAFSQTVSAVKARHFADLDTVNTYSLTNHVFDIFGLEYGLPLWTGGCVELGSELPARLDCSGLNFVQMTPSVCDLMLDRLENVSDDLLLLVGGEALSQKLLDRVRVKSIDLVNVYGPTETTIWSTSKSYRHKDGRNRLPVSIGAPLAGEAVYVLDRALRSVPIGAVGELCIGGVGLARGYLNKEEFTAERFVIPPVGPGWPKARRLYRTGDLVRLLPSGELEFVGRNDSQVKIDGHRIELGEIEAGLASHPEVRQSAVVSMRSNSAVLVGYYVADQEIDEQELVEHLRQLLPAYMVPARCVYLERMPLTINGKLDRAALPAPDIVGARVHVPPRSCLEADLCAAMARVVDCDLLDIGIDDDFFQLGGTSLLSIKLISVVERELGISTTVGNFLENRTIRKLVENLDNSQAERVTIPAATFARPEEQMLSFAQERLWFITQFSPDISAYNLPFVLDVAGDADTHALLEAVRTVIARHEVLRTLLRQTPDGSCYQEVLAADAPIEIAVLQVPDQPAMLAAIRRDLERVFDLGVEMPVRVRLYEVPDVGRRLVFVIHHIAFDGWSTDVLLEDLETAYGLVASAPPGRDPPDRLSVPQLRYRDFAVWQRKYLTGDRLERLKLFWQENLEDFQELDLVTDRLRPDSIDYRGANIRLDIGAEVSRNLRELAKELGVSLFSLLLSAHFLTLRCFANQDDIVVGSPIANRDHPQLARLVGFFVNTLPLRSRIDGQARVTDYVRQIARVVFGVLRHQELPLEQLLEILDVERNVSRHPVFQVTFGVQSFGAQPAGTDASSRRILSHSPETNRLYTAARFDLSTFIDDSGDSLELEINYATSLFERATVDSLAQTHATILRQFADLAGNEARQRQTKISDLVYVDGPRHLELTENWSAPQKQYADQELLHSFPEKHAKLSPERVALVCADRQLTYQELNTEANQLAHHLLNSDRVSPNAIIMLCLDRSADLVVSILATLKAGGGYLPVDPTYPDDRIAFMLRDAGVRTVLTHGRYAERFARILAQSEKEVQWRDQKAVYIIAVDDPAVQQLVEALPRTDPVTEVAASNLAYVLYTSGTTGKPKGVPQPHANVIRLFAALEGVYNIREDDVWTLFHNYVFDFTVWEMWGAFLYGGRLVLPTFEETRDPEQYYTLCRRERVTMLCQTPTAFHQFVNVALAKDKSQRLDDLRYVFFGGEPLNVSLLKEWFARYSYDRPLLAMGYGTTETTVFTCYKIYDETDEGSADIGSLIPDVAGYVLDGQKRLLPMGAVGELHIGGAGLAPGFLNLRDLTASKFITNPFVSVSGSSNNRSTKSRWNTRLYKSGDLVRWAPDRSLRFVGRNDHQVKIRGHRIELGEIEAVITGVQGVSQSAVIVHNGGADAGESHLVGYYVGESGVDPEVVKEQLRATLPAYMVPAALVMVDGLPRKISGKLDVEALPSPQLGTTGDLVSPRNKMETRARRIFAEVLDADPEAIGVNDDFFGLGGNSILSIKLARRLSIELGVEIKVNSIFKQRSVASLVMSLGKGRTEAALIPRAVEQPDCEQVLSFQQEWLWFVDRYEGGTDAYNIYLCYEVLPSVDVGILEDCLRAVYKRHEVLRTIIRQRTDGEPYPMTLDLAEFPLLVRHETVNGTDDLATCVFAEAARKFDLAEEPPFRITFYREVGQDGGQGRTFLGIYAHHIAFDGWSADVMLQELEGYYARIQQVSDGAAETPDHPELAIRYRDYAAWERTRLSGDRHRELLEYWKDHLIGRKPLELPLDRARSAKLGYDGERVVFEIDAELSSALRRLASVAGVGLFSVLLAAYFLMLQAFTGRSDLLVGVPVANRAHGQTHDLIGCFINSLAIDFDIDCDDDVLSLIKKVGARIAEAQEYQDLPFERLIAELNLPVDNSRHPLFQIWFDHHSFVHTSSVRKTDGHCLENESGRPTLLRYHALHGHSPDSGPPTTSKKLDVGLVMIEGETLVGVLTYAASLFERRTVERFASVYQTILMQFSIAT